MSIKFRVADKNYIGESVEDVVAKVFEDYRDVSSHPFANQNVLHNAVVQHAIQSEGGLASQPQEENLTDELVAPVNIFDRQLSAREALGATKAIVKMGVFQKSVKQPEATRRAAICRECPILKNTSDCGGCAGTKRRLARLAARFVKAFGASLKLGMFKGEDPIKSYCGFCGCSMQTLLPVRIQDYEPLAWKENEQRPALCWLRKDGVNFKEEE